MTDLKLVVTRGLSGSGKSTLVKTVLQSAINTVRVNRDDLRDMLFNSRTLTHEQENVVSVAEKSQVEGLLKAGTSVIVDAMHLRARYVKEWAKVAAKHKAELVIWDSFLDTPLEACIANDKKREGTPGYLGEDVIRGIHKRLFPVKPVDLTDIKPVGEPYLPNPGLPNAYMVDIDGTCTTGPCDRSPYEWAKVGQDEPNEAVIRTVWALYHAGHVIIFCSGRDAVCRPETEKWLTATFSESVMLRSPLFMRAEGDMRKDSIVKMELFDEHIRHHYNIIAVFDDRNQVVDMWRSLGLNVFQVAEGNF